MNLPKSIDLKGIVMKLRHKPCDYRIVVLGDSGCGKTALVKRFVKDETIANYDPTIEDEYRKKIIYNGKPVVLEIVDTSGKELLPDMLKRYIDYADAFIVCYSISSRKSFSRAIELFELISFHRNIMNISRILVGCKCDSTNRQVDSNEANQLSAQLQCSFAETSAFYNLNVYEVFDECVSQLNYIQIVRQSPIMPMRRIFANDRKQSEQWYPNRDSHSFCCFM